MLETGLGLLGKQLQDMLMTATPDPRCAHISAELLERYEEALARFPEYLQQMQAHMTYNATLETDFEKHFG